MKYAIEINNLNKIYSLIKEAKLKLVHLITLILKLKKALFLDY